MVFLFINVWYTIFMNTFSDPINIINQITFSEDAHIADFGCGAGAYSLLLAKKASMGSVFAIDVRKEMLERLESDAKSKDIHNIHVVWGDIDEKNGSRLREYSMDLIFITNTLFQIEKKKAMFDEAVRVMKPNARIIIVDWLESFGNIGPMKGHVVNLETAKLLAEESGLFIEKDIDAGEHHYGFIARKV